MMAMQANPLLVVPATHTGPCSCPSPSISRPAPCSWAWGLFTAGGNLEAAGSWLQISPAPAIAAVWGVNQQTAHFVNLSDKDKIF